MSMLMFIVVIVFRAQKGNLAQITWTMGALKQFTGIVQVNKRELSHINVIPMIGLFAEEEHVTSLRTKEEVTDYPVGRGVVDVDLNEELTNLDGAILPDVFK
eukprot:NODE_762_length_1196_cov_326.433304_g614_i0.p3 GENE.NODE_762_length_1196_cov_326.433304_g614_i0~~NODE_762_length_1196_cov_326.433304_g614_i0.p3  ORF type:complete len:102 (+),score=16.89 NODE_762_length_1196_cov_326.433304_g614_i0:219-524(+)